MSETIQGPQAAKGFLAALLNPSSEHALVYVGLVFILLVMTAGLYKIFVPNKGVKVTIYDVQNDGETKDKTKTKIKRPAAAVDTPDKTINKKKILSNKKSDEIDLEALQKDLDQTGPFPRTFQGTIEPATFARLRSVINKHGYKAFMPRKEELL